MKGRLISLFLLGVSLVLVGCAGQSFGAGVSGANATPTVIETLPAPSTPTNPPATAVPTGANMENQPTSEPTQTPSPDHGGATATEQTLPSTPIPIGTPVPINNQRITLANSGQTIRMSVDSEFTLFLGEMYDWQVMIDNQDIVSRVIGIMPVVGSQGVFRAHRRGTATLSAVGDPRCRKSQPPCGMPTILFEITIVVQ